MFVEEIVAIDCPCCGQELVRPLDWFRQEDFLCPACHGALSAGQFLRIVAELDAAFEASVAAMVAGEKPGCGCGGGGCGHGCGGD